MRTATGGESGLRSAFTFCTLKLTTKNTMKKFTAKLISCGLTIGLLSAVSAAATTITFDAVLSSGNNTLTTLTTDGFVFTSLHFHTIDNPATSFGGSPNNGTIYIAEEAGSLGRPITMALVGGTQFTLSSIDAAKQFLDNAAAAGGGFPNADTLDITGFLAGGGTVSASFSLLNSFQTFLLPGTFTALNSVIFSGSQLSGGAGGIALDNIGVNNGGGNAAPDAASTLALLSGTLAGLSLLRKK
jgi:hypothetical protein